MSKTIDEAWTKDQLVRQAAPELLEACKALLVAYRLARRQIAGTDAVEEWARAAIQKAEVRP